MDTYIEKARSLPIKSNVDVLVLGAGPAGFAAALASARQGAKTMLIEQQNVIGGIATAGYMSHWTGDSSSGIYREVLEKTAKMNENIGDFQYFQYKDKITAIIDPEKLSLLLLEMLIEAGVEVCLYTFASGAITEGDELKGVIIESKSGRQAVFAKNTVDATGDGDIAAKSGAAFIKGREGDNAMQPATVMFKVGGVDYERAAFLSSFETTYDTPKGELQELARKRLTPPAGHVLLYKSTLPGIVTCNMTNITGIDGTNAEGLTRAEIICRRQIAEIIPFLREFAPGYENCFLIGSASLIGIRETRHFKGLYTITEKDISEARQFPDWILKSAKFNFDVHNITGSGLDKTGAQKHFTQTEGYGIPFGCLIPEKIDNLLLSGRNISGTHIAHSNFRAMPICVGTGEAAGVIAALSSKNGVKARHVKPEDVQKILRQ